MANRRMAGTVWVPWGGVDYGSTIDYARVADALLPVKDSTHSQTTARVTDQACPRLICVERPEVVRAVATTTENQRNGPSQSWCSQKPCDGDNGQGKAADVTASANGSADRPSRVEFQEVSLCPHLPSSYYMYPYTSFYISLPFHTPYVPSYISRSACVSTGGSVLRTVTRGRPVPDVEGTPRLVTTPTCTYTYSDTFDTLFLYRPRKLERNFIVHFLSVSSHRDNVSLAGMTLMSSRF